VDRRNSKNGRNEKRKGTDKKGRKGGPGKNVRVGEGRTDRGGGGELFKTWKKKGIKEKRPKREKKAQNSSKVLKRLPRKSQRRRERRSPKKTSKKEKKCSFRKKVQSGEVRKHTKENSEYQGEKERVLSNLHFLTSEPAGYKETGKGVWQKRNHIHPRGVYERNDPGGNKHNGRQEKSKKEKGNRKKGTSSKKKSWGVKIPSSKKPSAHVEATDA